MFVWKYTLSPSPLCRFHLVKNIKLDDTDPVVFPVNFYLLLRLQNRLNDWINSCQYSIKNITLANMLLSSVLLLLVSYCGVDSFESCVAATCKAQMERESFWKPLNMNPTLARSNSLDSFRADVTLTDILCLYPKSQITAYFSRLTFDVVSPTWVGTHVSALFWRTMLTATICLPALLTGGFPLVRYSTGGKKDWRIEKLCMHSLFKSLLANSFCVFHLTPKL